MTTTREPHGVPHQLNVYVLDKDSDCTGYGTHARLIVFGGGAGERHLVYIREDLDDSSLPLSTEAQRRKVANGWSRMHPKGTRLVHVSSTRYKAGYPTADSESIEHVYSFRSVTA